MNLDKINNKKIEEELDFKSVRDNPIRWFGFIYPFFLVVIVAVGLYYISQLDNIENNKTKPALFDSTIQWTDVVPQQGKIIKGINLSLITNPNNQLIEQGKAVYTSVCSSCHGNEGQGDGPASPALDPKPRDLTQASDWKIGRKFSDIYKTLEEGISGTGMISYNYLPVEDRVALIHFVRSLGSDFPKITDEEIAKLNEDYKVTEDQVTNPRITIMKSIDLISKENIDFEQKLKSIIDKILKDNSRGAELLKEYTVNLPKAITTLSNSNQWRSGSDVLAKLIISGAPNNGFCPRTAKLTVSDMNLLISFVSSVI